MAIAPILQPFLVALLSFLTVFVDLSMGREAENMTEIMQEVIFKLAATAVLFCSS